MAQLEVDFAGVTYDYDPDSLLFSEFREIKKVTGLSRSKWFEALFEDDVDAVAALIYVLRKRKGEDVRFSDIDAPYSTYKVRVVGGDEGEQPSDPTAAE